MPFVRPGHSLRSAASRWVIAQQISVRSLVVVIGESYRSMGSGSLVRPELGAAAY